MTEYIAVVLGNGDYNNLNSRDAETLNDYFNEGWVPHEITAQNVSLSTGSSYVRFKYAPVLAILKKDTVEL